VHSLVFLLQGAERSGSEDDIVREQAAFFDSFHRPPAQPLVLHLEEFAEALQSLDDDERFLHGISLSFVTVGHEEHGCVEVWILSFLVQTRHRCHYGEDFLRFHFGGVQIVPRLCRHGLGL